MPIFHDEEGFHTQTQVRKLPTVTRQTVHRPEYGDRSHSQPRQEVAGGCPLEVSADVKHTTHLARTITSHRPNMAKWQVSNSVALPPHVTEQEVVALANILNRKTSSKV